MQVQTIRKNQMPRPGEVHVEFFSEPVLDRAETEKAGRPIYRDEEFVRIAYPNDRHRTFVEYAWEGYLGDGRLPYKEQFPDEYEAFRRGQTNFVKGTPLSETTFISRSRAEELKRMGVYTCEQLAEMDGAALSALGMSARSEQAKVREYLQRAGEAASIGEVAALKRQIEELKAQLNEQGGAPAPAQTTVDETGPQLDAMSDDALKAYIRERTGSAPRGNPNRQTLLRMASEAYTHEAA